MSRSGLTRRAFLGGAGAVVALPWMESLSRVGAGVARAADPLGGPHRVLFYYIPNGIHMPAWTPTMVGSGYDLPAILSPLANIQSEVSVISGLANTPGIPDGPGDHAGGTSAFLTCAHAKKTEGKDIQLGISADQVIANAVGGETTFPSIELGIDGGGNIGGCDSGYSCAYSRNISWAGVSQPLPKTVSPQLVFDRLFGGFDALATEEQKARRKLYRTSVLDYVLGDAEALEPKLGATDRQKLEQYMDGVRDLEKRIEAGADDLSCDPGERPEGPFDVVGQVEAMTDLMVLALQCDRTRILSFMLGNAGSNRSYDFLGVSGGHHGISHHQSLQENYDKLTVIDTWEVQQFANLVTKMSQVQEGESTLLDNSLVFFSSEVADGNSHGHTNLPVLLAGRGGGIHTPGRHLETSNNRPMADLFLSMMGSMGVSETQFANSSGALDLT
jgi:hypothetical protein